MSRSVGLTLYNLGARREARPVPDRPLRPPGRMIWAHAPSVDLVPGLAALLQRLVGEDGVGVVLTAPDAAGASLAGLIHQPPFDDTPAEAREFLNFWSPDLCLFVEGELLPATLSEAAGRGIPCLLAEGRTPHLRADREGWFPGLIKGALHEFNRVDVVDQTALRAFRKAGADADRLTVTGRLDHPAPALPYLEAERAALAGLLAGRPVWLAMAVPEAEEAAVIAAHRRAQSLSHRLLLILWPEEADRAGPLADQMEAEGLIVARRMADEEPEADVDVFLADQPGEAGLWYRLAPVTFLGGSLLGEGCGRSPFEPATTGSAILYGPRMGAFSQAYAQLGPALAARMVGSAEDLALGLTDLLSPDRAARQAHAAWEVGSEGALVSDTLIRNIRALLDGGMKA